LKILDRYIMASIAGTFLFSIIMFMGLLLSMDLMKKLVELIAHEGVPAAIALKIFAYRIPGMLVYAFPMSVLLSILLVFNRMSSESEMVAIRATGISFARIIVPALLIALLVSGITYVISDFFVPVAGKRAAQLTSEALRKRQSTQPVAFSHQLDDGRTLYTLFAKNLDVKRKEMRGVVLELYQQDEPSIRIYAKMAKWLPAEGHWEFRPPYSVKSVDIQHKEGGTIVPLSENSSVDIVSLAFQLKESPFDLASVKRRPEEFTTRKLREYVQHLQHIGGSDDQLGKARMWLVQRFATPFTCLVFALIGAPLGLRHHRTSNAMGLGISLLVIFAYYFFSVYLATFGETGRMSPTLAAWLPNVLGGLLGMVLIYRANR